MPDLYTLNRDRIKTGDPICFSGQDFLGLAIQARSSLEPLTAQDKKLPFNHNKINHVGTALRIAEYDNRLFYIEAQGRGVLPVPLSEKIKAYKGEVWHFPLHFSLDTPEYRKTFGIWALSYCGTDYAYLDIFLNLFGRTKPTDKTLFCSEHWWFVINKGITQIDPENSLLKTAKFLLKNKSPVPADVPLLGLTQGCNALK